MATLENILGILDAMGAAQIAAILALVATVLILLIILASRHSESADKVRVAPEQKLRCNPDHESVARRTDDIQLRVGNHEFIVKTEEKPVPSPDMAESARVAAGSRQDLSVEANGRAEEKSAIPEDSVLRRHYLANEAAKQAALDDPYPSGSVLRRHDDGLHKRVAEAVPTANAFAEAVTPASRQKVSIIEQAIGKGKTGAILSAPTVSAKISVPQDSVLRRHFIGQLRAEIEAGLSPKTSDSVLKRHYDSLVGTELEKRLAG